MQIKEAVLIVKDTQKQVSLQDIRIEAEVLDLACSTTIIQTYRNTKKKAIEAVYCFPVEEGAAVYDFEINTDGKTLKGVVEERDKAFETYDKAIEKGDASFLLDQESGDVLFISVGNIKPKQDVTVCIRYVKQLSLVDGIVRLQIPTTVSPRYAPSDTDPVKVDRITPDYDLDMSYRLGLTVKLKTDFIEDVSSPSHEITSSKKGKHTIISLTNGTTMLDRDFVLEIKAVDSDKPVCLWSTHDNGDKACMFRFTPQFDEFQVEDGPKSEIIFVLDCSGSMQGSSITEAKEALELSLRALSEGDLFNIIRFGNDYESYGSQSIVYSRETLEEAISYLQGIDADMGGTEILRPLKHICSLPAREGYNRDVLLITDGEVANPDDVIHLVADSVERNQFLRFFTIGIGYGASHHLVKGTARAGRGACEMIMPGEIIQPKVLRQLSRMSQPSITDVSLSFKATNAEPLNTLPPLFESDSYTVFNKLDKVAAGAKVKFSGYYLGKHYKWDAKLLEVAHENIIPILWALSKIKYLKTIGVGGSNQRGRREQRIKNEITKLGLRYNLLTDYTSFVAVEERTEAKKQLKQPEYRRIPVMMTRDWHGISRQVVGMVYEPKLLVQTPSLGRVGRKRLHVDELSDMYMRKAIEPCPVRDHHREFNKIAREARWDLKLLKTQQADGSFTGLEILGFHLRIDLKKLKYFSAMIDGISSDLQEKVLATWLAVNVLSTELKDKATAVRAIRKAKKWLSQQGAESPTVKGLPIEEAFNNRFRIAFN